MAELDSVLHVWYEPTPATKPSNSCSRAADVEKKAREIAVTTPTACSSYVSLAQTI